MILCFNISDFFEPVAGFEVKISPSKEQIDWRKRICSRAATVMGVPVHQVYAYLNSCGCGLDNYMSFLDEWKLHSALARMNRSLLERFFTKCSRDIDDLSSDERNAFLSFGLLYSRAGQPVKSWKDIDLAKIDAEFWEEMSGLDSVLEGLTNYQDIILSSVRKSEHYNVRKKVQTVIKRVRVLIREITEFFEINRYHIFSSEPDNYIFFIIPSVKLVY